jgi:hypothetical protein
MSLNAQQTEQFYALSNALGHNLPSLRDGSTQSTFIQIDTIEKARQLLSRASDAERAERSAVFMERSQDKASRAVARHDRAEAFVFSNHQLSEDDQHFIQGHLPIPAMALSVMDKTLQPNEVWDLGTSGPAVVLNIGVLTMKPGSRIVIRNSVLSLSCQKLIRESGGGGSGDENYDIGVLGANPDEVSRLRIETADYSPSLNRGEASEALVAAFNGARLQLTTSALVVVTSPSKAWRLIDFSVGCTYVLRVNPALPSKIDVFKVAMQGASGQRPNNGNQGPLGTCKCSGSEPGDRGGTGYQPADSGAGGPGARALDGLPSLRSEITINELVGTLVLRTAGGNGAQGGMGGLGGDGATGGKGGDGKRCAGTCTWGGDGGKGGKAGNGGPGGIGGNGGFAADLFVSVPATAATQVVKSPLPSLPGQAGAGGTPGAPGAGGPGGDGVSHNICGGGNTGPGGDSGAIGDPGEPGKTGGLAGRIVINGVG